MMLRKAAVAVLVMVVGYAAAVAGGQQPWPGVGKKQVVRSQPVRSRTVPIVSPRAEIGGGANGVYCTAPWDNGISVHDLGFIPSGRTVTVTVEGISDGFNPVAAVLVPSIGQSAGNTIKTTTFYDNDSGGDGDPRLEFVAPQAGTYLLMVNDLTDEALGCYRYQVAIR